MTHPSDICVGSSRIVRTFQDIYAGNYKKIKSDFNLCIVRSPYLLGSWLPEISMWFFLSSSFTTIFVQSIVFT